MLNEREKKLLRILLEASEALTTDILAFQLSVSSRTIKSDIKSINSKLKKKNIRINTKKGKGVWLTVPSKRENWIYDHLYTKDVEENQTKGMRKYEIAKFLLEFNDYISIEFVCDNLYYSRSAITKELDDVETIFEKYNLKLLRNTLGLFVDGNEKDIRTALVVLNEKMNLFIDLKELPQMKVFEGINIEGLYEILISTENKYEIILNDKEFKNIFYYLAIMIKRHKRSLFRRRFMKENNQEADNLYQLSVSIMKDVCIQFDLEYSQEEIMYFYWFISGLPILQNSIIGNKAVYKNEEVYKVLLKVLKEIDQIYHTKFSVNSTLIKNLYYHLIPAINRSKYNIHINNPLLIELKRTFAYAFEISLLITNRLEKYLDICLMDNEIGLFAMHIAAALEKRTNQTEPFYVMIVCTAGRGSSEFLKAKVQSIFQNFIINQTLTSSRVSNKEILPKTDFVISTSSLTGIEIPVVYVTPMLKENDIEKIQDLLLKLEKKKRHKLKSLCQLFDEKIALFQVDVKEKKKLLKHMCQLLINENYGNENVYDSLLRREKVSSTAIGKMIAIPHPFSEEVKKSGIGIAILKKPIDWGEEKVRIVFLLCISSEDNLELEIIMEDIFNIVQDDKLVMEIQKAVSLDQLICMMETRED